MVYLVGLTGFVILIVGLAFLATPRHFSTAMMVFLKPGMIHVAALLRIVLGVVFLLASEQTRRPMFILVVGFIMIVAGVVTTFMGGARLVRFAEWWAKQSDTVLRLWAVAAVVFGAAVLWATF